MCAKKKPTDSISSIVFWNDDQSEEIVIDTKLLHRAAEIIRALDHPLRKKMLILIDQYDSMTVTQLMIQLRIEFQAVSVHLKILRQAAVLTTERDGKSIYYRIDKNKLEQMMLTLQEFKRW